MCGIIGIISKNNRDDLGNLVASGLYQLQNRGDHSAGISTIKKLPMSRNKYRRDRGRVVENVLNDFNSLETIKGRGKVASLFNEENLSKLNGFMGVGQVRYPTTGYVIENPEKLSKEEKQKIILSSIQPLNLNHYKVSMVHNGDVDAESYHRLMNTFEQEGIKKATSNDLEAILTMFGTSFFDQSEHVPNNERMAKTVQDIINSVKGSYSVVALVNNVGLVSFRDTSGRRPLYFGVSRNEEGKITDYAFASETIALDKLLFKGVMKSKTIDGRAEYDEVKPGEMIFIDKDFNFFRQQIAESDVKICPFESAYFMRASSFFNNKRVKQIRRDVINFMWEEFKQTKSYENLMKKGDNVQIVPVPRTAESAAIYLQKDQGIPFMNAIEKHPYSARIFMQPTQSHRNKETIADHYVYKEEVVGKNLIIADDSIVRGTTMNQLVKYLIDVGAKSLHLFITFPPVRNPCHHGIDFHTSAELFSPGKNINQMKKELGLRSGDTLRYATPEIMSKAIGTEYLCNECYAK